MSNLIGYGAFGQSGQSALGGGQCPGQEIWDDTIGACNCPSGMQPTGIVGQCVPESQAVPGWGTACPPYTVVTGGCSCPDGYGYDPVKKMCTKEAYGAKAAPGPGLTRLVSNVGAGLQTPVAGMSVGAWLLVAVAAGGVAYFLGREGRG